MIGVAVGVAVPIVRSLLNPLSICPHLFVAFVDGVASLLAVGARCSGIWFIVTRFVESLLGEAAILLYFGVEGIGNWC